MARVPPGLRFVACTKLVPEERLELSCLAASRQTLIFGAAGRTRTDTGLLPQHFECCVYTNFTTAAL